VLFFLFNIKPDNEPKISISFRADVISSFELIKRVVSSASYEKLYYDGRKIKKNCKDKIEGIKWDNKPIKALGIYFGHDIDKCDELNWEGKINQMKKLLISWENFAA
jgi:oligoribonuclease NrnB/cAMP/cGMP phosphodiesterase (DHH superfamily)